MPNLATAPQERVLETTALTKNYGDLGALQEVSLNILPGVTALLGQNGAGKTTLINCALGLEAPSSGTISVFGAPPNNRASRQSVGVMLQDTELPDLLSSRELLELFASYYHAPMTIEAVVELAKIENFVDKRYRKLSGGQKRRIQFALAIVGDPDLVFLDEPTTGLDIEARKALWKVVRSFAKDGRSIILSTHYLEEADALADRIVILAGGKIIADAGPQELRNSVAGALIHCKTQLNTTTIETFPACIGAKLSNRITEIHTTHAPTTLRVLLQRDSGVQELTVTNPKLEDIFEQLTND